MYKKEYYVKNKERINARRKELRWKNIGEFNRKQREYNQNHIEERRLTLKKWREKNREKINRQLKDWRKEYWERVKMKYVNLLGAKCENHKTNFGCELLSTKENLCIFDFHHIDPHTKEYQDHEWRHHRKNFERKIREGKIKLLCSNCHKLIHHRNL